VDNRFARVQQQFSDFNQIRTIPHIRSRHRGTDNIHLGQGVLQSHKITHILTGCRPPFTRIQILHIDRGSCAHEVRSVFEIQARLFPLWKEADILRQCPQGFVQQFVCDAHHLRVIIHVKPTLLELCQCGRIWHAEANLTKDIYGFAMDEIGDLFRGLIPVHCWLPYLQLYVFNSRSFGFPLPSDNLCILKIKKD